MTRRTPQPSGFTLVELLVVIGVIAILIGLLLPVLGRARRNANDIKCHSNLRQIALATRMYENDNKDHLPDGYTLGGAFYRVLPGMKATGDPYSLPEVYGMPSLYRERGYAKSLEVWKCPSARPELEPWGNTYIWSLPGGADLTSVTKASPSNLARWTSLQRGRPENYLTYFVYDNYTTFPWPPASRRTSGNAGTFATQVLQHDFRTKQQTGTRQGSFNVMFIDGHVGVVVFTADGGGSTKTTKLRDPYSS